MNRRPARRRRIPTILQQLRIVISKAKLTVKGRMDWTEPK